jgi:hypothetical protein
MQEKFCAGFSVTPNLYCVLLKGQLHVIFINQPHLEPLIHGLNLFRICFVFADIIAPQLFFCLKYRDGMGIFTYDIVLQYIPYKKNAADPKRRF